MGHPFEMWADRIAAATTDEARRALATEARVLRARSLSDVVASRRATYTLSHLHHLLGERAEAAHEARQLLSLCQTLPTASNEEIDATRTWLRALGEHAPKVVAPPRERSWSEERPRRDGRDGAPRARSESPRASEVPRARARDAAPRGGDGARGADGARAGDPAKVRALAAEGRWTEALAATGDARGAGVDLVRAALRLQLALDSSDPLAAARDLRDALVRDLGLVAAPEDPLTGVLGRPAPARRAERIDAIEAFAAEHPERLDELASASLRHHLATSGPGAAAPWLAGIVARALATGGAATEAAVGELRAAGSVAVACYDEWPFTRLQRLLARAAHDGLAVVVRRGVLARHEPDDRKLWTMRAAERMLAVAPHAAAPYGAAPGAGDLPSELADRLRALCPSTLLLATGSGNEALRAAARERGLAVRDRDGDDGELLAELLALPAAPPPARQPRAERAERAERAPAADDAPAAGPAAAPVDRLADLVVATPLDRPRIQAAIGTLRRPDRALRIVQGLPLSDEALAMVLDIVAATIGNDRPIPEGTSLALKRGVGPLTREVLRDARYGGPGVDALVDVGEHLKASGWEVHRVLRGPTRRELDQHPALEALAVGLADLWRLLVREGGRRGEVWVVSELSPEGRAAVPLLLLEDYQRAFVTLGATPAELAGAVRWDDAGPAALLTAVSTWVARAEPEAGATE